MIDVVRKKHIGIILVIAAFVLAVTLIGYYVADPSARASFITDWMILVLIALSVSVVIWVRRRIKSVGPSRFDETRTLKRTDPKTTDEWETLVKAVEASRWNRSYLYQRLLSRIGDAAPNATAKARPLRSKIGLSETESMLDGIERIEDEEK